MSEKELNVTVCKEGPNIGCCAIIIVLIICVTIYNVLEVIYKNQ